MAKFGVTHVRLNADGSIDDVCVVGFMQPDPESPPGLLPTTDFLPLGLDDLVNNLVGGDTAVTLHWDEASGTYAPGDRVVVTTTKGNHETLQSVDLDGKPTPTLQILPKMN
ncbi:hypothetical protein [Methyloversatilis sp. XJ19-49]|uniref:hypothetical protein n=1 Tax=Methyloversatilis sp. XJ19-49 TaxID=2963429 RepID=UPI00211C4072|nr:hypothetical protein [Methyloversatilis sp. XJ19-49]MCQ9378843.1 hypothetical protein [Methyloversatilis sp. XJ19-49]